MKITIDETKKYLDNLVKWEILNIVDEGYFLTQRFKNWHMRTSSKLCKDFPSVSDPMGSTIVMGVFVFSKLKEIIPKDLETYVLLISHTIEHERGFLL